MYIFFFLLALMGDHFRLIVTLQISLLLLTYSIFNMKPALQTVL